MSEAVDVDYIADFVADMRAYGKSDSTVYEYERVLRDFDEFLGGGHADADRRDCMRYVAHLRESELSSSSVATYASYLHRFYSYLVKAAEYPHDSNPMALVTDEMDESVNKNPRRRELDVSDVSDFLRTVNHPRDRCMILLLFKTGIRAGELANLDLRHVSLSEENDDRFGTGADPLLNPRRYTSTAESTATNESATRSFPLTTRSNANSSAGSVSDPIPTRTPCSSLFPLPRRDACRPKPSPR